MSVDGGEPHAFSSSKIANCLISDKGALHIHAPLFNGKASPRDREMLRHTAVVFAATVVVNAANFGYHFGAVRLLGLHTYSAFAALLAIVLIFAVPANALQAVITTLIGEAALSHSDRVGALSRAMIKMALAGSCAIALVGLLVAPGLAGYLSLTDVPAVYLTLLIIAFGFSVAALRGVMQGKQRFGTLAISLSCEAVGNVGFGLVFITLFGGVRSAILGNLCGVGAAFGFSFVSAWKYKNRVALKLDIKRIFAKSIATTLALAALAAMSWADVILVRHLASAHFAGLYSGMSIVGKILLFSVAFVPLVLLAKASKMKGENRPTRSLLVAMLCVGGIICLSELALIRLMPETVLRMVAGAPAVAATPYFFAYACAMAALAMTTIIANYGLGTHRFAFVIPLIIVELGEILAINLWHDSLSQIVQVIVFGHVTALILTALAVVISGRTIYLRGALPLRGLV